MMDPKLPRCAALARRLGERPIGTASRITSLLLIEHTGPWSADVRERVLTDTFGDGAPERMDQLHIHLGLRVLVIRRPGRNAATERTAVFAGGCRPGRRWLERLPVSGPAELAGLDLTAVAEGEGGLGEPVGHPLLLVCTHGRKDACCAVLGRPVADALAARFPEHTWQSTHYGGDRWAGNLLVAPNGHMYGQLDARSAGPVAQAELAGRVSPGHLRGRVGIAPLAQVAEIAVRERTGLLGTDEVLAHDVHVEPPGSDGTTTARVQVSVHPPGAGSSTTEDFEVTVLRTPMPVTGVSACSGPARPHRFEILGLRSVVPA